MRKCMLREGWKLNKVKPKQGANTTTFSSSYMYIYINMYMYIQSIWLGISSKLKIPMHDGECTSQNKNTPHSVSDRDSPTNWIFYFTYTLLINFFYFFIQIFFFFRFLLCIFLLDCYTRLWDLSIFTYTVKEFL